MLKDTSLSILRDSALENIKSSDYHTVMLDESWGDEDLIYQDLIGLMKSMDAAIKDITLRLALDEEKLRGLFCDGCSSMMGKKKL